MLSILSILSIFSCKNSNKIYINTPEYSKFESEAVINGQKADEIYQAYFLKKFPKEDMENIKSSFRKIVYVQNGFYHFGYIHKLDKKGPRYGKIIYGAKVDSKTGEIYPQN